jgi:chemotaxis protein MotB
MLALFVVMYAVSRVNISKYKVLAESLARAFHGTVSVVQPVSAPAPTRQAPQPNKAHSPNASPVSLIPVPIPPKTLPVPGHEGAVPVPSDGRSIDAPELKAISAKIVKALSPWIKSGEVSIHQSRYWLEINIQTDVLFPTAVATLSKQAHKILAGVAGVLAKFPNPVRIEGYTDSRPIDTQRFPSNWELSASRAAVVARLFGARGVDPERLGIVGWSQYRPAASNETRAGRAKNRRITIVVLATRKLSGLAYASAGKGEAVTEILEPLPVAARVPAAGKAGSTPGSATKPASKLPPKAASANAAGKVATPDPPGSASDY